MIRAVLLALLSVLFTWPAMAEVATPQLVGDRLRAGELRRLEDDLAARLAANTADDQVRYALGLTQFLRTIEGMAQAMYQHGLEPPRGMETDFPFFRFPVPRNPSPEPLDYQKMRGIFADAISGFATADATLARMSETEVKLPVAIGLARLDLNGDGKADDGESLWSVFDRTLGGGNLSPEIAERFVITFDRADAAWLRGYSHLLSALLEFVLAHDWKDGFDASFHMFFPRAGLPGTMLDEGVPPRYAGFDERPLVDLIAFIHLMHWKVVEPERLTASLGHLEHVVSLSRESWRFILAETDDEAEWIPSPAQKNRVLPGAPVTQQTVDGWMMFLSEFDAILQGKTLIPHWRLAKGINFRRVFTEPRTFDPILWAQGSAALPYLEDGPMTDGQTWGRIMMMFEGNFLGYAVWFN
ncbi:MAG: hypothetical protein KDK89_20305 [Alphaproteobacteria bacterium]|nr:hypothetical protein [Alphaproteobacteria bacterium]